MSQAQSLTIAHLLEAAEFLDRRERGTCFGFLFESRAPRRVLLGVPSRFLCLPLSPSPGVTHIWRPVLLCLFFSCAADFDSSRPLCPAGARRSLKALTTHSCSFLLAPLVFLLATTHAALFLHITQKPSMAMRQVRYQSPMTTWMIWIQCPESGPSLR